MNSGFRKAKMWKSAEIWNSLFWKDEILKLGFWKAKISKSANIPNLGFLKAKILKSDKILNSEFWKAKT